MSGALNVLNCKSTDSTFTEKGPLSLLREGNFCCGAELKYSTFQSTLQTSLGEDLHSVCAPKSFYELSEHALYRSGQ